MGYPEAFIDYFKQFALTLTSLRKAVLFCLWNANRPLKAYDILNELLRIKPNMTPTAVYRVLDFFIDSGVIHKIESMQAYTLCSSPHAHHATEILMVCDECGCVIENYDPHCHELLSQLASQFRFKLSHEPIEMKGTCSDCQIAP